MSTPPMTASAAAPAAAAPEKLRFPPQVKYIVGNEGCERFSFYGMTSILTIYMARSLGMADHDAEWVYHLFIAAVYFMPLFGGWLSDRLIGRYKTILWLSFGYVAGHATIAIFEGKWGLYAGMALIALGAGGIKPCVSAFVGDQFDRSQASLIDKVYALFYLMINVGSIGAQLLIPKLLKWYGPSVAFGVPGVLMAIALVVYVMGRKHYVKAPPVGREPDNGFVKKLVTVRQIIYVFAPVIVFWALFYQYGSAWVLQAEKMNLHFIVDWESSQISFFNSLFVITLLPLFSYGLYPALAKRGYEMTPLRRMTAGMFLTTLSFVAAAMVQASIDAGNHPNVMWQVFQYLLMSIGEVLVSVTALEFAYTQAPANMKSTIMGLWFVVIAAGSFLTAVVAKLNTFSGAGFYWFFVGLMFVAAVIFALIARTYRPVAFVPGAEAGQQKAAA